MSYIKIICPYCSKEWNQQIHPGDSGERLLTCDTEEYGCGGMFVLILRMEYFVFFKKIEGEEKKHQGLLEMAEESDRQNKEDYDESLKDRMREISGVKNEPNF